MPFDDDKVGYCSPPKNSRFKKGQSGNPKGRPRGSHTLPALLEKALRETVVITEKGKRKTVRKAEALMKQLVNRACAGEVPAARLLFTHGCALLERLTSERLAEVKELANRDYDSMSYEELQEHGRALRRLEEQIHNEIEKERAEKALLKDNALTVQLTGESGQE